MMINTLFLLCGCTEKQKPVVALSWHNNQKSYTFVATLKTVKEAGAEPIILDKVRSTDLEYDEEGNLLSGKDEKGMLEKDAAELVKKYNWHHSNVEEIMKDVKCLIMTGGVDISPYLYENPEEWLVSEKDNEFSAERDVSDYILAKYCIDKDIPLLCICRGMQVLSIVSGAKMIQDIPTWFENQGIDYEYLHREINRKEFVPHDVTITDKDSLIYKINGSDVITKVPSWHHQAVESLEGSELVVTGTTLTQGKQIVETVERKDRKFIIGVQYHPEAAIRKIIDKEDNADDYMDYDSGMCLFKALIKTAYGE